MGDSANLLEKIEKNKKHLENILKIITGVAVYATEDGRNKFILAKKRNNHCYPLLEGGASINSSYCIPEFTSYINYDKNLEKELNDVFERRYLRERGSHQRPFNLRMTSDFQRPKIFLRQSDNKFTATFSDSLLFGNYSLFTLYDLQNSRDKLFYVLGLLNSKLMTFYGLKKEIIKVKEGKTPQIRSGQRGPIGISQLPIREVILKNKKEKASYDDIIRQVESLLELNNDLRTAKRPDEIDRIKKRIAHSKDRIDEFVYELYDFGKKEIQIIEKIFLNENS